MPNKIIRTIGIDTASYLRIREMAAKRKISTVQLMREILNEQLDKMNNPVPTPKAPTIHKILNGVIPK